LGHARRRAGREGTLDELEAIEEDEEDDADEDGGDEDYAREPSTASIPDVPLGLRQDRSLLPNAANLAA
jgi:hypothetical protein